MIYFDMGFFTVILEYYEQLHMTKVGGGNIVPSCE